MVESTREDIEDFLAQKRLALVGLSRDPKDFSRILFLDLIRRGYDVVPVNPLMSNVEGRTCFARVQDIEPPVDAVLVMTPPEVSESVVRDCAEAGIKRVWLHRGAGTGAVSPAAVAFCEEQGMRLVAGYCPYMFMPDTPFFHHIHGFILRLVGSYPVHART